MLEVVVGVMLVALGLAAVWLFSGDRAREFDLDLAYLIGAAVFSVPAIVILELRRRRGVGRP
jgi:pilus assembly protein TadC